MPNRSSKVVPTSELPTLMERDRLFKRSPQQRAVFDLIKALGGYATAALVGGQLQGTPAIVDAPGQHGLAGS